MLLKVTDVSKSFGAVRAVDGVDFSVSDEDVVGVIGPNGAGKTTLFNLIAGSYTPDTGTIEFNNTTLSGLRPNEVAKAGVGRTFQIPRPFKNLSVRDNLLVARMDDPKEVRRHEAAKILNILSLDHEADTLAKNLSGGQQALLEIGRVLMLDPELVLLDEPAAGVNPGLVDRIARLIEETKDERTYLLVEHEIQLISRLCEHVIVLNEGRIIADGPMEEIKRNQQVREAYLGEEQ